MNKTHNVYEQQLIAKGRDLPKAQPSTGKVPARFADRFATYEEYQEAMADFLNGMWLPSFTNNNFWNYHEHCYLRCPTFVLG